jgi:hypothetical protein
MLAKIYWKTERKKNCGSNRRWIEAASAEVIITLQSDIYVNVSKTNILILKEASLNLLLRTAYCSSRVC